jgi:hypothetical protein
MCRPLPPNEKDIVTVQETVSNDYASELLFRFCGLSRYSEELFSSLRYMIGYLAPKVKEPDTSYEYIEEVLKHILSKDQLRTILPMYAR